MATTDYSSWGFLQDGRTIKIIEGLIDQLLGPLIRQRAIVLISDVLCTKHMVDLHDYFNLIGFYPSGHVGYSKYQKERMVEGYSNNFMPIPLGSLPSFYRLEPDMHNEEQGTNTLQGDRDSKINPSSDAMYLHNARLIQLNVAQSTEAFNHIELRGRLVEEDVNYLGLYLLRVVDYAKGITTLTLSNARTVGGLSGANKVVFSSKHLSKHLNSRVPETSWEASKSIPLSDIVREIIMKSVSKDRLLSMGRGDMADYTITSGMIGGSQLTGASMGKNRFYWE